jgi:hypothetical protein
VGEKPAKCAARLAKAEDYYPQLVGALEKYRGRGLWVHFSDIPKIGVNPRPPHRDPSGVYLFPLDHVAERWHHYTHWAFRPYMFVCRVAGGRALDLSALTHDSVDGMLDSLGLEKDVMGRRSPAERLWGTLEQEAHKAGKQNTAFRRLILRLGFDMVRDPGGAVIHSNEPDQLLVLSPGAISVVELVEATTRRQDGADGYYANPKYPFYGRSAKPAVELLFALARAMRLKPGRVRSHGKGSWSLSAEDGSGNLVQLAEHLVRSGTVDYKSFRAAFTASWYSGGRQADVGGRGPDDYRDFDIHTGYDDAVAPFAGKALSRMAEMPPDDASHVEGQLRGIAAALGGAEVTLASPVRGSIAKRIGASELRLWLSFEHPESSWRRPEVPSYAVDGALALPKGGGSLDIVINPSFGQYLEPIPAPEVVGEVVARLPEWLEGVLERNFPAGDARYDFVRRHTLHAIEFLRRANPLARAAGYRRARLLLCGRRPRGYNPAWDT